MKRIYRKAISLCLLLVVTFTTIGISAAVDISSPVPVEENSAYDVIIQDIARQGDGIARTESFVAGIEDVKPFLIFILPA
jgi:predicted RNA-binding protein with TRAM domain